MDIKRRRLLQIAGLSSIALPSVSIGIDLASGPDESYIAFRDGRNISCLTIKEAIEEILGIFPVSPTMEKIDMAYAVLEKYGYAGQDFSDQANIFLAGRAIDLGYKEDSFIWNLEDGSLRVMFHKDHLEGAAT